MEQDEQVLQTEDNTTYRVSITLTVAILHTDGRTLIDPAKDTCLHHITLNNMCAGDHLCQPQQT